MVSGGISIHVVDASSGLPAIGVGVTVYRKSGGSHTIVGRGAVGRDALVFAPSLMEPMSPGAYELEAQIAEYFSAKALPLPALLDTVSLAFSVRDSSEHIHLPLKLTAVGFSLFRGDP